MNGQQVVRRNIVDRCNQKMQHYLAIWVDSNINLEKEDCKNVLAQLRHVISEVKICPEPVQCIQVLNEHDEDKVFVISSGSSVQNLVVKIHDISQVDTIYVFCDDKAEHEQWAKQYSKIRGVFTTIETICESLKKVIRKYEHNCIPISFVPVQAMATATTSDSDKQNLDQLPPSYMYSFIFKEIILEITDDEEKQMDDLIDYCRRKGVLESQLTEFNNKYNQNESVLWYTKDSFLYRHLNHVLRSLDVEGMVKFGFFIRHLYLQLLQLHQAQSVNFPEPFTVYRGQGLSQEEFRSLYDSKGGLLSFNTFLSTSRERNVAMIFAPNAYAMNEELIGVLFTMIIDPAKMLIARTPFAKIKEDSAFSSEEEVLFAMHAVFRVIDIVQTTGNSRLYEVQLRLTDDNDLQMATLTHQLKQEFDGLGWHRLGKLMLRVGDFKQAEELYNRLLDDATSNEERAQVYHQLGQAKYYQGECQNAITFYQKYLEIELKAVPKDNISLAPASNNIALCYNNMSDYPRALEFYEKSLNIREKTLSPNHPDLAASYSNIAGLYNTMGDYSKALEFYQKSLNIREKALPPNHPDLATSYNNVGIVYEGMGKYSKAFEFCSKSRDIREKTLPQNHPDLAQSYDNIALLYKNMGDYSKALEFYKKVLEIREKTESSSTHSDLAISYNSIATVFHANKDYSKALEFYDKALKISEKTLSANHLSLAASYNNIGLMYKNMGDVSKAVEFYEKSLKIREKVLPANHPDLAISYNNIGLMYDDMDDYLKALGFHEKSLKILENFQPPSYPRLAAAYNNIGLLYQDMNQYDKALEFLKKSLVIHQKYLQSASSDIVDLMASIASVKNKL